MNNYYTRANDFIPFTRARSGEVDNDFDAVVAGFDFLPTDQNSLKRGRSTVFTESGAADAYVITTGDTRTDYQDGDELTFKPTNVNTGASTLNVDAVGTRPITSQGAALTGGELPVGRWVVLRYDSTTASFELINATVGASAAAASAAAAAASAAAALISETSAEDWAIRPEDDPVPVASGGDAVTTFSALHWAAKSALSAGGGTIQGTGVVAPTAGSPYDYDAVVSYRNANSLNTAQVGWDGASLFRTNVIARAANYEVQGTDAVGTAVTMASFNPEAGVGLHYAGSLDPVLDLTSTGIRVETSSGANVTVDMFDSTLQVRRIWNGGQFIDPDVFINGAPWQSNLRTAGGVQRRGHRVDADTGFEIHHPPKATTNTDGLALVTEDDGVSVRGTTDLDPTAGANQDVKVTFGNFSGTVVGDLGYSTGADLQLINRVHGGSVILGAENTAAGAVQSVFRGDPDGSSGMFNRGVEVVTANIDGITIASQNPGTNAMLVSMDTDGAPLSAEFEVGNSAGAARFGINTAGNFVLEQWTAAGGSLEGIWIQAFRDAEVQLRFNNLVAMFTDAAGITVRDTAGNIAAVTFQTDAGVQNGVIFTESGLNGLTLRSNVHGGFVVIDGEDDLGSVQDMIIADPENAVTLHHNGTAAARTAPNTSGTGFFEVHDGVDWRRVYGVETVKKNSATTRTDSTALSADPDLSVSLAAGNYKVEVWLLVQSTGGASDIEVGLDWDGALNDTRGLLWTGPVAGGSQNTTGQIEIDTLDDTPSAQTFGSPTSAGTSHLIKLDCIFDANGSGTLAVHWTSATTNSVSVVAQSRMEVTLLEA